MWCPTRCLLCQTWGGERVCGPCRARSAPDLVVRPRCHACGLPRAPGVERCADCVRLPPPQARAVVAVDYEPPWDQLLLGFKHGQRPEWAAALADLLARAVSATPTDNPADLVVPVPLSAARLARRGYNQAWELARRVARQQGVPASPGALVRWVDLPQQAQQDRAARLERLQGVFGVPAAARHRVVGRHVALVDDVYTTGATAAEAVRTLLSAGAREVSVWALARTLAPLDEAS